MAEKVTFTLQFDDKASVSIESLTNKVKEMGGKISEVTKGPMEAFTEKLAKFGLASEAIGKATSAIKGIIAPSAAFDTEMRKANTMMGLNNEEFDDMKTKVRELSKEVPMAGDALAKGLYQVISTGTPASEAIDMLRVSARASVGGIADLEKVVGVTATVLKNYGLQGGEAAQMIQDKIQLTAKNGVTSFEQLAEALPKVAGNAATLGVGIDELMATFSTLTGVSGNTAEVSTQLGAIFTSLVKPSSEASKMAEAMGIQFDAAAIKAAGGMSKFLANLKTDVASYAAQNGMLESEIYASLFGSAEAVRALTPLQGELSAKFIENIGLMKDSAGTIDEAFGIMEDTSENRMQSWANKIGGITDFINDNFGGVIDKVGSVIDSLSQLGGVLPVFQSLGKGVMWLANAENRAMIITKVWTAAQKVFNIIANMNPIGLVVIAVTALIAAIGYCIAKYDEFGAAILFLTGPIGILVNAFMAIKNNWDSIVEAFKTDGILGGIKRIGIVLLDAILYPVQQLLEMLSKIPGLGNLAASGANKIQQIRERLNLTEPKKDDGKSEQKATTGGTAEEAPGTASTGSIKKSVNKVTTATSDKGGQIKNININIDKVVEQFTVSTTNIKGDMGEIKNMIAKALVDAVNDVNYAI